LIDFLFNNIIKTKNRKGWLAIVPNFSGYFDEGASICKNYNFRPLAKLMATQKDFIHIDPLDLTLFAHEGHGEPAPAEGLKVKGLRGSGSEFEEVQGLRAEGHALDLLANERQGLSERVVELEQQAEGPVPQRGSQGRPTVPVQTVVKLVLVLVQVELGHLLVQHLGLELEA
jgi:hypothetical protein